MERYQSAKGIGAHEYTNLLILHDETFVDTWLEHLNHLRIRRVVTDVLQNIAIGDNAECTEHNPDGNIGLDVWESRANNISEL